MAELRSETQFRLKIEIVPLKFSRKSTSYVDLRFIKDFYKISKFQINLISVLFFSGNTIFILKSI